MNSIITYLITNPLYIGLFIMGIAAVIVLIVITRTPDQKLHVSGNQTKENLSPKQKTANDIVNVKDIDENFIYTKDGYLIGFLRLGNINIELLSLEELNNMTQKLAMSFEGDRQNFDYFTIQSQVNLDPNKDCIKEKHQETDDLGKRKGLNLMLLEMTRLSTSGENFEHQHYIKVWKKIGTNVKDTQNELMVRLREFRERYTQVGIPCTILKDKDIIKMCSLFGNPQQAPFIGSSIFRYENTTILKEKKR